MKRLILAAALACTLSATMIAGEIPTGGAPVPGEIPSTGASIAGQIPTTGVAAPDPTSNSVVTTAILLILGIVL